MRKITDKKELTKLVSFMIMGDGGVYPQGKEHAFIMNMVKKSKDYIDLCRDILDNVTTTAVVEVIKDATRQDQLRLSTKSHPFFTTLRDRIYVDKYKSIDNHALKLLDYEALSFLYMSDGSLKTDFRPSIGMVNPSYDVTLNLKRLSYGDLLLLKKALKDKLDLEWNINKNGKYYYLRLRSKDINKFMLGISSFITPSFKYKILDEKPHITVGDDIV